MSDRPTIHVHLLPSLIPVGALSGGVAVVLDVLRATTVMVQALAAGCEAIIPCLEIEEARRIAASLPPGTALLGGERHGLPIEGFDLGNSPGDYTPERCRGKTLVMTTTNGTKAILACLEAERVLVASYRNVMETWSSLIHDERAIHIVCAGTENEISLEDTLVAGVLTYNLAFWRGGASRGWENLPIVAECNDAAIVALAAAWDYREVAFFGGAWQRAVSVGRGGRRVTELDLVDDIKAATSLNRIKLVADLARDPVRIIRTG